MVLYIKEQSSNNDPFANACAHVGYSPQFIAALQFVKKNQNVVCEALQQHACSERRYGGVVVTSPRGAEAYRDAIKQLIQQQKHQQHLQRGIAQEALRLPVFVVGEGTKAILRNAEKELTSVLVASSQTHAEPEELGVFAEIHEAGGNGRLLGEYIVKNCSNANESAYALTSTSSTSSNQTSSSEAVTTGRRKPFLYLTGNLHRKELTHELDNANIPFEEIQVYDTELNPNFHNEMIQLLQTIPSKQLRWMVFFSPSGVNAFDGFLRPHNQKKKDPGPEEDRIETINDCLLEEVRYAAIGETTAGLMKEKHWVVSAIAKKPTAGALVDALLQADDADKSAREGKDVCSK